MRSRDLLLLAFVPAVTSESCSGCISKDILEAPAYGIDLSLDHLTLAVKFANGTLQSLNKINGSDEYREALQKCLNVPDNGERQYVFGSRYTNPWMDHVNESVVNTLTQEIQRLVPLIDGIETIAVSIPASYTNFLATHVKRSMAGLELPLVEPYNLGPRDLMAISAFESGFCLFGSITPPEHCGPNLNGQRNERYPSTFILVVEYDLAVLAISSVSVFQGAVLFPVNQATLLLPTNSDDGSVNWETATKWITTRIGSHRGIPSHPKFNKVVLVGERAMDADFKRAVWAALRTEADVVDLAELEADIGPRLDPEFVPALGAAQIAKDWRDAPKPIGCSENDECKNIRKEVFDEASARCTAKKEAKDEL